MENALVSCDEIQTVDNILNQVAQLFHSDLWKTLQPVIKVQGIATSITRYPKVSYFTLVGADSSLSVKCPTEFCPIENQEIIVKGLPSFKASKYHRGISIVIEGKPIGEVTPSIYITPEEIVKDRHIKLSNLIGSNGFKKLMVLGSEMTIRDVISQIDDDSFMKFIDTQITIISDKDKIIESIKELDSDISSFALVRGGDDDSLLIWNDMDLIKKIVAIGKPFYVALGHTHRILGISHYADESFGTPSVFGSYLNQTFKAESQFKNLESEVTDLTEKLRDTIEKLEQSDSHMKSLKAQQQKTPNQNQDINLDKQESRVKKEWIIIGVLIVVIYFLI